MIIADRAARTPAGMTLLVELAEALQAPVIDQGGRMNFPTRHPLNHTERSRALVAGADVILGLELTDFWGTVHSYRDQLERTSQSITKPGAKLISITAGDLFLHSNYQDFERYPEVDLAMAADAEATLPSLIEAVKRLIDARPQERFRSTRRETCRGPPGCPGSRALRRRLRLGREPHQHGSPLGRTVGADQERRLVAGIRRSVRQPLAPASVEFR